MSSSSADECFNEGEIFEVSENVEALFEEPSVGEEESEIAGIPHTLNVFEVCVEVLFNCEWFVGGL